MANDLQLPFERAWPFLWVRRGLPLTLGCLALGMALVSQAFRGWYLLGAVAFFAEVAPTFLNPRQSLKHRRTLLKRDGLWVKSLLPLMRIFHVEEGWVLAFCAWNNRKVAAHFSLHPSKRALLLLPHCIQIASCKLDVISDLSTCKQCGRCSVGDCVESGFSSGWEMCLSNRSHKAYREARAFQPELVVAVSCWSRLLKGLLKLPEVPCYVIPLQLPHGMCVDTQFNVSHLRAAMAVLTQSRNPSNPGVEHGSVDILKTHSA